MPLRRENPATKHYLKGTGDAEDSSPPPGEGAPAEGSAVEEEKERGHAGEAQNILYGHFTQSPLGEFVKRLV